MQITSRSLHKHHNFRGVEHYAARWQSNRFTYKKNRYTNEHNIRVFVLASRCPFLCIFIFSPIWRSVLVFSAVVVICFHCCTGLRHGVSSHSPSLGTCLCWPRLMATFLLIAFQILVVGVGVLVVVFLLLLPHYCLTLMFRSFVWHSTGHDQNGPRPQRRSIFYFA